MHILATADIHGVSFVYEWLIKQATACVDAIVIAGDLLDADLAPEQEKQAQRIVAQLRESSIPVLYIMGNDDNVSLNYEDSVIRPIHGRRLEIGVYNFVGYQYTPPFVGEAFVKSDDEIAQDLLFLEPLVDNNTVFVTHSPAYGSLDLCYGGSVGSCAIAEFLVRKPVLAHIHGHIHHRFGRDGNHFNVAAAATCRAMLIDLPSLHHEVITLQA